MDQYINLEVEQESFDNTIQYIKDNVNNINKLVNTNKKKTKKSVTRYNCYYHNLRIQLCTLCYLLYWTYDIEEENGEIKKIIFYDDRKLVGDKLYEILF